MQRTNKELVIFLPEGMEDVSVRIVRNEAAKDLQVNIFNMPEMKRNCTVDGKQHALVWHQDAYSCMALDDITWIEASGSYCRIHATKKRTFTLSYPLSDIAKELPRNVFIRIQRSYLVNINHVRKLIGKSFLVDDVTLKVGENYMEQVFSRFLFLGAHRQPLPKQKGIKNVDACD